MKTRLRKIIPDKNNYNIKAKFIYSILFLCLPFIFFSNFGIQGLFIGALCNILIISTFIISLVLYKLCIKKILKDARNSVYSSKNRFLFLDISKNPLNYSFVENELGGRDYIFTEK